MLTPAFMPVGTRSFVNHMTPHDLKNTGSQIILGGNTYHILLNPGMEIILTSGGMHRLMTWEAPMLTDSGGFQVFSLSKNAKICRIDAEGAHFKHPMTGKVIHLMPKALSKPKELLVQISSWPLINVRLKMAVEKLRSPQWSIHIVGY